jgi:hypothetical protein
VRTACTAPAGVGEGAVGHDPLDRDAQAGKPAEGAGEEGGAGGTALGRQDFGMGQPGGVVHRDVQGVRPQAAEAAPLRAIAVDRWPTVTKRGSALRSTWRSSPGRSRW